MDHRAGEARRESPLSKRATERAAYGLRRKGAMTQATERAPWWACWSRERQRVVDSAITAPANIGHRRCRCTNLTHRTIAALPLPSESERQPDYWDDKLPGFGVRVSYGGRRAFVVRYRAGRRIRRLTIEPYGPPPGKSLAHARSEARSVLGKAADGEDPAKDKRELLKGELFRELATAYLEMAEKRHRSWREEKRIIDKDLLPIPAFSDSLTFVGVTCGSSSRTSPENETRPSWPIAPWACSAGCLTSRSIASGSKRIQHHVFPNPAWKSHAIGCSLMRSCANSGPRSSASPPVEDETDQLAQKLRRAKARVTPATARRHSKCS